ncbi:MAG: NAD(P)H-hydrate epimerase [Alphaproteobacteria bacterium]|nr:NAD(P)H-hydrate epimerase [Alphaproteobacteria bacterium]
MLPTLSRNDVPHIDTDQMIEIDRMMAEEFNILPMQMMENAGRAIAQLARLRFLNGDPRGKKILALSGNGGNGGDALVAARMLLNWGADMCIALSKSPEELSGLAEHQLKSMQAMNINGTDSSADIGDLKKQNFDLIIDGLIGFSLKGAPYGLTGELISYANETNTPILAVDNPSGINSGDGRVFDPAIKAAATLTLALPKTGLYEGKCAAYIGELYLADISVPQELYDKLSLSIGPIFSESEIIKIV